MLKEGMFIQERYEIISKIGSGGMADVYKAKDHKLNRYVAVKVLKPEFRDDKAFISKFRVEAQSAAGLAHPNIVNVYDVGDDNGIYFIVMELVEGITLKEYIEKKGRLAVREATSIAIQVSMGLQAAHHNNIVHRDVKPQNIIISTDGKVKVTDFGIARAASSNTISSNVMGSVHYSSPEQARGGYSDFKSDIYSLGITMYEMLTGHVPFDGDTTVAIAIKHLQEEMQSPRKYVPDLPKSTVQIIYKCTQKSPDRRYNDMEELIRDLKESLVNPEGDFVQIMPLTNHAQTVVISKEELDQIKQGKGEETSETVQGDSSYGAYGQDAYGNENYGPYGNGYQGNYGNENYPEEEEEEKSGVNKKLEKFMTVGSIVIGVIILLIFLTLVGSAVGLIDLKFLTGGNKNDTEAVTEGTETDATSAGTEETVAVPDLLGMTRDQATEALNKQGLGGKYGGEKESSEYPAGLIVEQDPAYGTSVSVNTPVVYYISSGAGSVPLPDISGMTLSEAQQELKKYELKISTEYAYSGEVEEGLVISTTPGFGSDVTEGDTITVIISKGPQAVDEGDTVNIPSVLGKGSSQARSELEDLGLYVEITEEYSSDYDEGLIMKQSISSGTEVTKGTTIELTVSIGPLETEDVGGNQNANATYVCNVDLKAPSNYSGEPVKIVIEQDGKSTTILDGQAVTFPYRLTWTGTSDSLGTAYIYVTNNDGSTTTVRYDDIPFTQVN
ncbi:MAG: Stk1 family PASTA domain-containing Ser/Thr kinase [Lachnospiraceae bacterium]|nr:Stk1 family PASTA domain-containing Ser/Thr kinase [Lachnospiraceae bacterium]